MSDHLTEEQITAYDRRTLPPEQLLQVDDHLALCPECRGRLVSPEAVRAGVAAFQQLFQATDEGFDHLPFELMACYVDGTLNAVDREIVEGHLEYCDACAAEVRDLRGFRALMSTYPTLEYAPADRPSLWHKIGALWNPPARTRSLRLVGAAAAAVLVMFMVSVFSLQDKLALSTTALQQQRNDLRATQDALQQAQRQQQSLQKRYQTASAGAAGLLLDSRHWQQQAAALQQQNAQAQQRLEAFTAQSRQTPQMPSMVVAYNDQSAQYGVDDAGNIQRIETLSAPVVGEASRGRSRGSASSAGMVRLLSPVNTAVDSETPTFRWQPLHGAASYQVRVSRMDGETVAQSGALTETHWTPDKPLPRGEALNWNVEADRPDGTPLTPVAESDSGATFRVLDQQTHDHIAALRRQYADAPLALGVLYAQAGLYPEATQELRRYVRVHPQSPGPRKLLAKSEARLRTNP